MLKDRYGNSVSTSSQAALAKYDEALDLIRLYRGDPVSALDAALSEDPDFGAAWAASALAQALGAGPAGMLVGIAAAAVYTRPLALRLWALPVRV